MKIITNISLNDEYIIRGFVEVPDDASEDEKDKITWDWVEKVADVWWEDV